jgi:mycothiol synthase
VTTIDNVVDQQTAHQLLTEAVEVLDPADPHVDVVHDHLDLIASGSADFVISSTTGGYSLLKRESGALDIVLTAGSSEEASEVLNGLLDHALALAPGPVTWWTRQPLTVFALALAAQRGGRVARKIDRMELSLTEPIEADITTRPFTDDDLGELLRINNEAFADHPDRSSMTEQGLRAEITQLGDRYDDILLMNGGFCWTKRQPSPWGELYVIGVDTAHQGRGVGTQLVSAGLAHLQQAHGATSAFLYVEHNNLAARSLYEKLGFVNMKQPLTAFAFST